MTRLERLLIVALLLALVTVSVFAFVRGERARRASARELAQISERVRHVAEASESTQSVTPATAEEVAAALEGTVVEEIARALREAGASSVLSATASAEVVSETVGEGEGTADVPPELLERLEELRGLLEASDDGEDVSPAGISYSYREPPGVAPELARAFFTDPDILTAGNESLRLRQTFRLSGVLSAAPDGSLFGTLGLQEVGEDGQALTGAGVATIADAELLADMQTLHVGRLSWCQRRPKFCRVRDTGLGALVGFGAGVAFETIRD